MSETTIWMVVALALLLAGTPARAADPDKIGPVTFTCDDGSEIMATFDNAPDPATVLLVRGDQQATLPQAMSGSGARTSATTSASGTRAATPQSNGRAKSSNAARRARRWPPKAKP